MMGIWTRKSLKELADQADDQGKKLKRVLGPIDLILLGIGAIIGAGLFSITGIAAAENAGPAIVFSFLIAALGCFFAGLCYCELASMIPIAGSAYTYTYATMGELIAWMMGWTLILEYALGAAAVSISWSSYVVSLLNSIGVVLPVSLTASPWQSQIMPDGSLEYGIINLPAVLIVMLISWILIHGIKNSSYFNNLMVGVKVAAVLVFIVFGFFYIDPNNYVPFIPPNTGEFGDFGFSGILQAAGVLFFAYIGFDAVSTAAQETIHPQRNVPIGIIGSLIICALLYVSFGLILTGLVYYPNLNVAAPVAVAAAKIPFPWINTLLNFAVLAGLTSVILVMLLGQSRIFYTMARDGLLPPLFSNVHPEYHTPWFTNIVIMLFVSLIGAFAPISAVGHMTSIGTLLAFTMVCLGVIILRRTDPQRIRPFKVPFSPFVPLMGVIVCFIMMYSLDTEAWIRLFIWLAIGLVIYIGYGYTHSLKRFSK